MIIAKEFKTFILRGNVVDLAVGVVIGAAFGKIVTSLVADIIMPPVGLLLGGVNFTDIKLVMKDAVIDAAGKVTSAAVTLNVGSFVQTVFDFTVIAAAIFMLVKVVNKLSVKKNEVAATPAKLSFCAEPVIGTPTRGVTRARKVCGKPLCLHASRRVREPLAG